MAHRGRGPAAAARVLGWNPLRHGAARRDTSPSIGLRPGGGSGL